MFEHAEVAALRQAKLRADALTVVRITKDGFLANSKPCKICRELLQDLGVKDVYYSTNEGTLKHKRKHI